MGEINIPRDEQDALTAIDASELDRLIEAAIREERLDGLHRLPLSDCGRYVAMQFYHFENALTKHRQAKAVRKREQTESALRRAGYNLSSAVRAMKQRMETERREGQRFSINDHIVPPHRFDQHLSVRVNYQWRPTVEDEWTFGSITFRHEVGLRPDFTTPAPKRKLSAAKQEQDLQDKLYEIWAHLMRQALYSVRDYFREGGDGEKVPGTFDAVIDANTGGLNNFSTRFWRGKKSQPDVLSDKSG